MIGFTVSNDDNALFSIQPTVSASGTLNYTSAADANGAATVTIQAHDDGGTAGGGSDTSAARTFTITVTPVNDAPVATADSASVAEDDTNGVTVDVLSNDSDVDTGDTLSVAAHDASGIANGTLSDHGGGSFAYIPDPGFFGTETFTYDVSDGHGGTADGNRHHYGDTGAACARRRRRGVHSCTRYDAERLGSRPARERRRPRRGHGDGRHDARERTANGSVSLAADGSFDYTPTAGFTGTDSFAYRIDDGTGRNATATVVITVAAAPPTSSTLYFQSSGSSPDLWDLLPSPAPVVPRLTDLDSDGKPGLTIKNSDGKESVNEGAKYQIWSFNTSSPLQLDGPVTLDLWSSAGGSFGILKSGTLYSYLYDCAPGGSCTRIASNSTFHSPWNTSLSDWGERTVTIGSVTRTIPAGNELRVKLLFKSTDLWLMMSAGYPTALSVTLG